MFYDQTPYDVRVEWGPRGAQLTGSKSPETEVCIGAYQQAKQRLADLIWDSASGRELREKGFGEDVRHCTRVDVTDTVPVLREGLFVK